MCQGSTVCQINISSGHISQSRSIVRKQQQIFMQMNIKAVMLNSKRKILATIAKGKTFTTKYSKGSFTFMWFHVQLSKRFSSNH